jgi:hypothetical protein
VVLDSKHASRQHARLDVSDSGVLLSDLESANGVWVNGRRIEEPVFLQNGDRVVIGQDELQVFTDAVRPLSQKLTQIKPMRPALLDKDDELEVQAESERSSPGTRRSDFFDLVGKIVERAIEERRIDDATTMLQSQLTKVLADARAGRGLEPATHEGALRFALLLAEASGAPRWLDYALDLMTALARAPGEALARKMAALIESVDGVDPARISAYVAALESIGDLHERMRVSSWARGLGRASSRRPR